MEKSDFMHFVISVRWHCTILMKTTGLNEGIDFRPECTKMQCRNSKIFCDMGVGRLTVLMN